MGGWGVGDGFGGWVDYQGMHPAFSGLYLQNWGYYMRRGISFPYIFPFPEGEFNNTKWGFHFSHTSKWNTLFWCYALFFISFRSFIDLSYCLIIISYYMTSHSPVLGLEGIFCFFLIVFLFPGKKEQWRLLNSVKSCVYIFPKDCGLCRPFLPQYFFSCLPRTKTVQVPQMISITKM